MQPSYLFTDKEHRGPFEFSEDLGNISVGADPADNVIPAQGYEASDNDLLLGASEKEDSKLPLNSDSAYSAPDYNASVPLVSTQVQSDASVASHGVPAYAPQSTFGIDDMLGLGLPITPSPPSLKLNPKPVLQPDIFQRKWVQLAVSLSQVLFKLLRPLRI